MLRHQSRDHKGAVENRSLNHDSLAGRKRTGRWAGSFERRRRHPQPALEAASDQFLPAHVLLRAQYQQDAVHLRLLNLFEVGTPVESASRALIDPTPARIESLVHDLAMKRLLDGQFDECGLTLSELHTIEDSLVKSLTAVYHGRVKYPEHQTV